jgi:hypothetical protein
MGFVRVRRVLDRRRDWLRDLCREQCRELLRVLGGRVRGRLLLTGVLVGRRGRMLRRVGVMLGVLFSVAMLGPVVFRSVGLRMACDVHLRTQHGVRLILCAVVIARVRSLDDHGQVEARVDL